VRHLNFNGVGRHTLPYEPEVLRHPSGNPGLSGARDARQNGQPLGLQREDVVGNEFLGEQQAIVSEGLDQGGGRRGAARYTHHLVQVWLHSASQSQQGVGHPPPRGLQVFLRTCQVNRFVPFQQDGGPPFSVALVEPQGVPLQLPIDLLAVREQSPEPLFLAGPVKGQEHLCLAVVQPRAVDGTRVSGLKRAPPAPPSSLSNRLHTLLLQPRHQRPVEVPVERVYVPLGRLQQVQSRRIRVALGESVVGGAVSFRKSDRRHVAGQRRLLLVHPQHVDPAVLM